MIKRVIVWAVILGTVVGLVKYVARSFGLIPQQTVSDFEPSRFLSSSTPPVHVTKIGTTSIFVLGSNAAASKLSWCYGTRECKVEGFLPMIMKENTTYIFYGDTVIESTDGQREAILLENMKETGDSVEF